MTQSSIFDDFPSRRIDPRPDGEAEFAYLNRSGRPEAWRVRQLADEWFAHYPVEHRDILVTRFRSARDDEHHSAFFELFTHELLIARGHKVVAIEPKLSHTLKSPDFLVQAAEGHRLYLECVLATGRSAPEVAAEARLNRVRYAIDQAQSPAHFLDMTVQGVPSQEMSIKKVTRALRAWIEGLPGDESAIDAPPFKYEEHGASISLRAWPRRNRDPPGRAIGVRFYPARTVTNDDDVRSALKGKVSRYRVLDHPYVVAVNALDLWANADHALDALLGSRRTAVHQLSNGEIAQDEVRANDGIWRGPKGPQNTRLSAVLSTELITPWNFASRRVRLIRNPWAARLLPPFDLGTDEYVPEGGQYRIVEGRRMHALFGLPAEWPQAKPASAD